MLLRFGTSPVPAVMCLVLLAIPMPLQAEDHFVAPEKLDAPTVNALGPADAEEIIWRAEAARLDVEILRAFAMHPEASVRARTARALGHLRRPAALPLLQELSADLDTDVRREAAFALCLTPGAAPVLLARLGIEKDETVAVALMESLGAAGRTEDLPLLRERLLLAGNDETVALAKAFGQMGVRGLDGLDDAMLLDLLLTRAPLLDVRVRRMTAFALARIGAKNLNADTAGLLLERTLGEPDATARAWLIRAASVGLATPAWTQVAERMVQDTATGVRVALARGLARRVDEDADRILGLLISSTDRPVRLTALEAAARAEPGENTFKLLDEISRESDPEAQALALLALHAHDRLDDTRAWLAPDVDPIIRAAMAGILSKRDLLLDLCFKDPDSRVRAAAMTHLLELDPPLSGPQLIKLLVHPEPLLAAAAAAALAEHPDAGAESPLLDILTREADRDILLSSMQALTKLYSGSRPIISRPSPRAPGLASKHILNTDPELRDAARTLATSLKQPLPPVPATWPDFPQAKEFSSNLTLPLLSEARALRSARVLTDAGEFVVEFDTANAPVASWNWVSLARRDFFDNLTFHRVVADFVVQGGDPRGDGWGSSSPVLPDEFNPVPFDAWSVGMAISGPDSGSCQWFVTLSAQPHLDGNYTRFGRVVQGQDVVRRIEVGDRILDVIPE